MQLICIFYAYYMQLLCSFYAAHSSETKKIKPTWPPATSISFEKITVMTYTALADNPFPQQAPWLGKLAWETVCMWEVMRSKGGQWDQTHPSAN